MNEKLNKQTTDWAITFGFFSIGDETLLHYIPVICKKLFLSLPWLFICGMFCADLILDYFSLVRKVQTNPS